MSNCLFCAMFADLFTLAFGDGNGGYAKAAFNALLKPANAFSRLLATFLVVWTMLQFMLYEEASREIMKRSIKLIAVLIAIGFLLGPAGGNWLFETIILGMQKTGLGVAQTVIAAGVGPCGAVASEGAGGTYQALWAGVECVGFSPVRMAAANWAELSGGMGSMLGGLGDWLAWAILAFPYLFVLGIFGAFLAQSMFYFLALAGTCPVILLFVVFDATRGIVWSGLKFLLTGALTIVFAGMAMGFTGSVLFKYANNVATFQSLSYSADVGSCATKEINRQTAAGHNPNAQTTTNRYVWGPTDAVKQIFADCRAQAAEAEKQKAALQLDRVCDSNHFVCTKSYWAAFLIGMMSVLLHLLAPKIAANLSGASDSAATAAAVVGAGQFAAAKALGWGKNSASWAGGAAGRMAGMALGGAGGGVRSIMGAFGPGSARDAVHQQRMSDQMSQLSLGLNNLASALNKDKN
jgi:hypothetical protein